MADQRLKDLRGSSRRDFLRWSATVAAVLARGLETAAEKKAKAEKDAKPAS